MFNTHRISSLENIEAVHQVLLAIQKILQANDFSMLAIENYRVGLGTLAAISMASARKNINLNLLVWDLAEMYGYDPTESMFEDVIMSFAEFKQDENMVSALVDMERQGFMPSRALLQYIARKVSFNERRLHHFNRMLSWRDNPHLRSIHSMHVLLVGFGLKKDINAAFRVFEDLPTFELTPNGNTFEFLMEILYIDTKDRFPYHPGEPLPYNQQDVEDILGAAQIILDSLEEAGAQKTRHFFHEHIRLLCALGLLKDAHLVFQEALSVGPVLVNSPFLLATRLAKNGDFESARAVVACSRAAGCGNLARLDKLINNIETPRKRDQQ